MNTSYIPPFKRNNIYEVLSTDTDIYSNSNSNSNTISNSNKNNNKFNRKRNIDDIYMSKYVPKVEFKLNEEIIQKEFPSLGSNQLNKNLDIINYNGDMYIDMLKKEKVIVPVIGEDSVVKNDVRTIVNRYKNELVPFEERTYDSDGWMTNEDWLEYYEYNKRI
jgi:hypothetical protein